MYWDFSIFKRYIPIQRYEEKNNTICCTSDLKCKEPIAKQTERKKLKYPDDVYLHVFSTRIPEY